MKKSFLPKLFATMTFALAAVGAWAVAPQAGKVYRVENKAYGKMLCDNGPTATPGCAVLNESSSSQLWLLEDAGSGNFYFHSLGTDKYLKSSSQMTWGWSLTDNATSANALKVAGEDGAYTIAKNGDGSNLGMHCDGSSKIVCWNNDIAASQWQFHLVDMTQAEIDAALKEFQEFQEVVNKADQYAAALTAMFEDKACTVLKSNYASMSDANIKADSNYKNLSSVLQNMVLKVRHNNWAENDPNTTGNRKTDWDGAHAKKFRVQKYEPYSPGAEASNFVGIQAYTNMNQPTGILSDSKTVLYVMVDAEPKDGSKIFMSPAVGSGMFNDYEAGTQLHAGLNVIPCYSDCGHQFIYYTVQTTENGQRARKLSDFDDITIHIEGGSLNGFFDYRGDELYTADTNQDYLYYRERARHDMFDFVGKYVILHFFFEDTPVTAESTTPASCVKSILNANNTSEWDLIKTMKLWDRMCLSERLIMGLEPEEFITATPAEADHLSPYVTKNPFRDHARNPFSSLKGDKIAPSDLYEYFNGKMMGITMQGNLYMNATSWRTAYSITTITDILRDIWKSSGLVWGPAHEYGHMNQTPMKIAGTTEISNNVFSNVAVYYGEIATSRSAFPENQLEVFNNDRPYIDHSTWGFTRMFLQLFDYYHACEHNTKFYPRLYQLLREKPLQHPYYCNSRYDVLRFVEAACDAAEEDLIDYFTSWNCFTPMDGYLIGDYSNTLATLTQKDIDEVKAAIRAKGYPINRQIINIDDRPGETQRESWWGWDIENAGPLGGLHDFATNVQPKGNMCYNLNGSTVNVVAVTDGEEIHGGTGFIMYDSDPRKNKEATVISFSNRYSFELNNRAITAVIKGEAFLFAVGADGTLVEVANNYANSTAAQRINAINALLSSIGDVSDLIDETETHAGWYRPKYMKELKAAIEAAKACTESTPVAQISQCHLDLISAYEAVKASDTNKINFIPASTYNILVPGNEKRCLGHYQATTAAAAKVSNRPLRTKDTDKETMASQQWKFVLVSTNDDGTWTCNIQNVDSKQYWGAPAKDNKGAAISMVSKKAEAGSYIVSDLGDGKWSIADSEEGYGPNRSAGNASGEICWWTVDDNTKWILVMVEADEKGAAKDNLVRLVADANALLPKSGSIKTVGDGIDLTENSFWTNAAYTGENAADAFSSWNVIIDGSGDTYFHSDYSGNNSTDRQNHYLGVDLGEGHDTNSFQFSYTTRSVTGNNPVCAPTKIRVQGADSKDAANSAWKTITTLDGLPEGSGTVYTSPIIESEQAYRYLRFQVMSSTGGEAGGHPIFVIAEFSINHAQLEVTPDKKYPKVTEELMMGLYNELYDAETLLAKATQSKAQLNTAYEELVAAYNALAEAMGEETIESSIEEIIMGGNGMGDGKIYDLQGRQINRVTSTGIYIVNGKKVLLRAGR